MILLAEFTVNPDDVDGPVVIADKVLLLYEFILSLRKNGTVQIPVTFRQSGNKLYARIVKSVNIVIRKIPGIHENKIGIYIMYTQIAY